MISQSDKNMLIASAFVVLAFVALVFGTAWADARAEATTQVWIDTEYCTPADGGLMCEVDPGTFE